MTTNLFLIANVKQMRTNSSFRISLPIFFQTSWSVGILNLAIFNSFQNPVGFGPILGGFQNLGGGFKPPPPLCYATALKQRHKTKTYYPCFVKTGQYTKYQFYIRTKKEAHFYI